MNKYGSNTIAGDGTRRQTFIQLSEAPPAFVMLDVSNERENVYSARIANNGTATITSQSSPFIESVSRTGLGTVLVTFKSGFFSVTPSVNPADDSNTGSISIGTAGAASASSVTIETFNNVGNAYVDRDFSITVQRQGADYRPPKAFVANAVSLTQANTNGVEYQTNETIDGKQVYARKWKLSSNISSTTPIDTIPTGLEPTRGTKTGASNWYITGDSYPFQSENYALPRYNSSTGLVDIEINNVTIYSGQIITLEYTKP